MSAARPAVSPLAYLSCIRFSEVLVLQGSPLFGVAFALHDLTLDKAPVIAVFALASVLLVANIWTFNDWANGSADLKDPNRSERVFSTKGVSSRGLLVFSLGLLAASLIVFALLPRRTLILAVVIAVLGVIYSHPALNAKGVPIVSSCPHLVGGTLHFLLGYSLLLPIDRRGVLIGLFFGLTFTAGHLNQEVRDCASDRANRLWTNAVAFGNTAAFLAGAAVFTLAYADLALLAYYGVVPRWLGVPPLFLFPIHLFWTARTLRDGLGYAAVSRFQSRYRALFALIGLAMVAALLLR